MASVFVSYRNGDAPFAAALVYRMLAARFGTTAVFWSSESIPAGATWAEAIWDNHRDSAVLIAMIGPRWLSIVDVQGRRRLWVPGDWVHDEIVIALREGKLVIPVLLRGVPRLDARHLPPGLAGLARLQAVVLDHRRVEAAAAEIADRVATVVPPVASAAVTPPAWSVPRPVPSTVDRDEQLRSLRRAVGEAGGSRPVVLHGAIGSGKTQLAIGYADRHAADYRIAWLVSGSEPVDARLGELPWSAGRASPSRLGRADRCLLIFDGFDDPAVLAPYLSSAGTGTDVLITSRHPYWGPFSAARQELAGFSRAQSVRLLADHLPAAAPAQLDRLASALGDLPLAVAQAAGYLAGSPMDPATYVRMLGIRSRELLARGGTVGYPGTLAASWSVALDRLAAAEPDAAWLLELACLHAHTPVPLASLAAAVPATTGDPVRLADVARALARSGLATVDGQSLRVPALLAAYLRQGMTVERVARLREAIRNAPLRPRRGGRGAPIGRRHFAVRRATGCR